MMVQLSELVLAEAKDKKESNVFLEIEDQGNLILDFHRCPSGEYWLSGSFEGTPQVTREEGLQYMIDFLRGFTPGKIDSSDITINLKNKLRMSLEQSQIPEFKQNHYKFEFLSEKSREHMAVLADIAERVYGLQFIIDHAESGDIFVRNKDKSKGVIICGPGGLKYGTTPERDSYKIIRDSNISPADKKKLGAYDEALVKPMPDTHRLSGFVLQEETALYGKPFLELLEQLPNEVESVSIGLSGDKTVTLCNDRPDRMPDVIFHTHSKSVEELSGHMNHLWRMYDTVNNRGFEGIRALLQKQNRK